MLLEGVFSFNIGVVGLFGNKYMKAAMIMVIALTILTIVKLIVLLQLEIDLNYLYGDLISDFFVSFNIFRLANKGLLIIFSIAQIY